MRTAEGEGSAWGVVADPQDRRVTARTPMTIAGPVRGTIDTCAHAISRWNTCMTAGDRTAAGTPIPRTASVRAICRPAR